jgi:hypothetical protein
VIMLFVVLRLVGFKGQKSMVRQRDELSDFI